MNWLLFASISIISISIAGLFQRLAMKKTESDPVVSSIIFQFLVTLITAIFAFIKGFELPTLPLLPFFLISSLLYAFGTLFIFKAIKKIEASELSIVAGVGSFTTIISAFIFLDERLRFLQLAGVVLIFLAVWIINRAKRSIRFDKSLLFALIGNSLYGLAVTNDAYILKSYDAISYTPVISFIPGLILCLIFFNKIKSKLINLKHSVGTNLVIYSTLYGVQAVTYYLALENGALVSQMSAFFKIEIILTVTLATIFLSERKNLLAKAIALFLALGGAYLITT
jgi:drug/metabolite transporter (DMT)-like permease